MADKKCCVCSELKPRSEFYKSGRSLLSRCKPCHRAWAKEYKKTYRAMHPYEAKRSPLVDYGYATSAEISKVASVLWQNALKRSANRSLSECDLTREYVESIVKDFCENNYHGLGPRHPFRPSLDRLDRSKGYTKDNIRIIWLIENLARNTFTDEQVIEFCKRKLNLLT